MVNLAVNGVGCECGSLRLAPSGDLGFGEVCICSACARVFRVCVALVPLRWSELERALAGRPYDLHAFAALRDTVLASRRETLPELPLARANRWRPSERAGVAAFVVVCLIGALMLARAVWS